MISSFAVCGSNQVRQLEINVSGLYRLAYAASQGDVRVNLFLNWLGYLEVVICVVALGFIVARRQWREYWALGSFLAVRAISSGGGALLIQHVRNLDRVHRQAYYLVYFYLYWGAFAIESVLALVILYSVFRNITGRLRGIRILGTAVFCIVAFLSVSIAPLFAERNGRQFMVDAFSQLQRTQSIVMVCLFVFVCFAVRSLGLSYRSKLFGVTLGLGILAITNLLNSVWFMSARMHGLAELANSAVVCATLALWAIYFAMREPERHGVAPGSVLFRWNERTLALLG